MTQNSPDGPFDSSHPQPSAAPRSQPEGRELHLGDALEEAGFDLDQVTVRHRVLLKLALAYGPERVRFFNDGMFVCRDDDTAH